MARRAPLRSAASTEAPRRASARANTPADSTADQAAGAGDELQDVAAAEKEMTSTPAKKKRRMTPSVEQKVSEATVVAKDGVTRLTLQMHQAFATRIAVKEFVHDFALAQGKRAVKDKRFSSGNRFLYVCNSATKCGFMVRGSKSVRKGVVKYVVTAFDVDHGAECTGKPVITQRQVLAQLKQAAADQSSSTKKHASVTRSDVQDLVKSVYGADVPSRMAYRAKGALAGKTLHDATLEIQKVESLLSQFQMLNPTAAFHIDTDEDGEQEGDAIRTSTFKRAFLKLPYADRVQKHSARIVGFDGMDMGSSSSFRGGQLLELVAKDGNNDSYILAMALCEGGSGAGGNDRSTTAETYSWFFHCCLSSGIALDMPMVCDRSTAMLQAAAQALPLESSQLVQCTQHLIDNTAAVLKIAFSKEMLKCVWQAQAADTEAEFDAAMALLSTKNQRVADHLRSLDPQTWTKYCFSRSKSPLYGWQTTTLGEAENPATLAARERGPIEFFQSYMERCMHALYVRKSDASEWFGSGQVLTSFASDVLDDQRARAASCCVSPSDGESGSGYVWDTKDRIPKKRRVNISTKSCSCPYAEQMGLPCKHLVAAVHFFNTRGHSWSLSSLCDPIYTVRNYFEAYSQVSAVDMPVEEELVRNVSLKVKAMGTKRCSLCHEFGHNKRNCRRNRGSTSASNGNNPEEGLV